jgi:peptide/nickel transport system substrate-binding protein
MKVFTVSLLVLAAPFVCFDSSSVAAENVVRFTSPAGGAFTLDPHANPEDSGQIATRQIYEVLVDVESDLRIVPQLAVAWRPLNPTTWVFELRQGVRFHDGTPFTAADVVFSLARARAKSSDLSEDLELIANVEAVDD